MTKSQRIANIQRLLKNEVAKKHCAYDFGDQYLYFNDFCAYVLNQKYYTINTDVYNKGREIIISAIQQAEENTNMGIVDIDNLRLQVKLLDGIARSDKKLTRAEVYRSNPYQVEFDGFNAYYNPKHLLDILEMLESNVLYAENDHSSAFVINKANGEKGILLPTRKG